MSNVPTPDNCATLSMSAQPINPGDMKTGDNQKITPKEIIREIFAGSRATIPMIVGAIPFGIIFGTLAEQSGLSPVGAIAMSIFVFAGSSQFCSLGS